MQKLSSAVKTSLAVAIGATALATFAPAAHAVVVTSPVSNLLIPVTTAGLYINVITGVSATAPAGAPGWDINPWSSTGLQLWAPTAGGGVVTNGTAIASLPVGTSVGPSSVFTAQGTAATAGNGWVLNNVNYFGFRFVNEATGGTHYGYGVYSLGTTFNSATRSILNIFYEDVAGAPITVAAIPEPGTYGLMGLGLAAVALAARRRKQAA